MVMVPFAVTSVVSDVTAPQSHRVYDLTPDRSRPATRTHLHLDLIGVDEWQRTVTLRVTGQHICAAPCTSQGVAVLIISIPEDYAQGQGLPPAQEVMFQSERSQPLNQTIELPLYGEPVHYPFDAYRLTLRLMPRRVPLAGTAFSTGAASTGAPPEEQNLFASLRATPPRMSVIDFSTDSNDVVEGLGPASVDLPTIRISLGRPVYLKVLTVLLVMLVTAAAAFAVFLRALGDLVLNSGALVLGVWGIRAVLLGAAVPGLTAVDLALSVVILFLLLAITVRAVLYLSQRSGVHARLRKE